MKNILYLSFYFEPDLCAGSFRNTPLVKELAKQVESVANIDLITTVPNRYASFHVDAPAYEATGNLTLHRVLIPKHRNGMQDQIYSFKVYYSEVLKLTKNKTYDLVIASSSRLFTAYLGYRIAKKSKIPLYLDIRDIFSDTMKDVLRNPVLKAGILPTLRAIEKRVFDYATHINLISGGFKSYFEKFKGPIYTQFPNGIDPEFLNLPESNPYPNEPKVITYAGNIGEGQGLHKIIPQAAKLLGNSYQFIIIGDGGAKKKLADVIQQLKLSNVTLHQPVPRAELLKSYYKSDFLFIHLNDYEAFEKVLPSKVFELAAYDKPIIAGVAGYAYKFIEENISNKILFAPNDIDSMVAQLRSYQYQVVRRELFIENFKRENINKKMAASMIRLLNCSSQDGEYIG